MTLREIQTMQKYTLLTSLFVVFAGLAACAGTSSLEEQRTAFFATVDGSDEDCTAWLEWCVEEGHPQEACEERSEYCVDGEWVGGDRDDSDPCRDAAGAAERACLADGGTAEECREAAADAYDECSGE
jgi:hypothetical protein